MSYVIDGPVTISNITSNAFLYSGTSGTITTTASPSNGQLLIGSTSSAPVISSLIAGTGITITNGPGSITISSSGGGSTIGSSAFFAFLTADLVLGDNATITGAWTTTYNDGSNFSTISGIYTVPGNGFYQISFQASSSVNGNTISLVVNGVITVSCRPSGTNTTAGNSLTLKLTAGQTVLINSRSATTIQRYAGGITTPIPRLGGTYFSITRLT